MKMELMRHTYGHTAPFHYNEKISQNSIKVLTYNKS